MFRLFGSNNGNNNHFNNSKNDKKGNKMKKVLFTATVDSHILQFHIPYLKMFKEKGYEVHVATNGTEAIPYCDVKHVVSFSRSPIKTSNLKAIIQLRKIINENNFEIVHCHTPMGSVVTRIAAKKAKKRGTRVIYTAHGFHFFKGAPMVNWLVFYPVEKYLSKYTDCLITINQEDYELAKRKFKKCKQIELVHGVGVDESKFDFEMSEREKHELRENLGLRDDDFVLIQVGELNKNKNQIMSINAMKELVKEKSNIHLLLVGQGELEDFYKKKIKEYNLQKNIHMLGYRNDIPKLLKISNVLLSLSYREGLPVNVIEGMISGLPIIATDCRGNRDLIENPIQTNNIRELNEQILKKYKKNIKSSYMFSSYLEDYIIDQMKEIYEDIVKKKIMHLLASNSYSGAENVVINIINQMKNIQEYQIYYCSPKGEIVKNLEKMGINYLDLKKLTLFKLRNIIKENRIDIIHAHDFKASCLAALFYKKTKIVSHIHGNNKIMNKLNSKSLIYYLATKKFEKIIWVSDSSLEEYYFYKKVKNLSIVLYNVIDVKKIKEKVQEYKINYQYDLMYLGRLEYPKNPERLIRIIKQIREEKKDISVAIVGNGKEKQKIQNIVKKLGLNNNITFYGFQQNPFPILKNAKLLIMTSIYEGTPMSVLEAQAMGIPVISTPVDGLKKIIRNDYNGFLSDKDEILVDKILEILSINKEYEEMKRNSLYESRKRNDIESYIGQIKKIYDNISY